MAYFGPMRRSPRVSVLDVALLRLRRKPLCGLASGQNLPFLNEHLTVPLQKACFGKSVFVDGHYLGKTEGVAMKKTDVVLWFKDLRREDIPIAGGKCAQNARCRSQKTFYDSINIQSR